MQRLLDIVLSGLALLVLSPLLVPIAIALRLTGESEVFFTQQRVGRGGQPFGLYKFATMLKNSPNLGTGTVTIKDDPRVLPLGGFLRKTKINELPQLLNIFTGDMSIIGPRPQTQRCFDAFPPRSQAQIIKVRPGLSGIGSIVFRDEEELMHASREPERFYDDVIMPYKGVLEEWYVANQGIRTYLASIFLTAWVVLCPESRLAWRVFPGLPKPPGELGWSGLGAIDPSERYRQVAALHAANIDQGFLTSLGGPFLSLMYRAIDEAGDSVLLMEEHGGRVVGFVAGGLGMGRIYRRLLRRPFRLAWTLLPALVDPPRLKRILDILRYSHGQPNGTWPEAELLSIAVDPAARGTGVAERLFRRLEQHFRDLGVQSFRIAVGESLAPAHRYYQRMGAKPMGRMEVHAGEPSIIYVHDVNARQYDSLPLVHPFHR